jgi:tetratricopeptide (TPR) repeat protein
MMKELRALAIFLIAAMVANAQELPQKSPAASCSQTVGLTDIGIQYSSPAVRGRQIFGDLVPFDQVWRTGANACTKVSFSSAVFVEGERVEEGMYALFTIPSEDKWTVILNADTSLWGAGEYDEKKNILVVEVPVEGINTFAERLTFGFENLADSTVSISMHWANRKFNLNVRTELMRMIQENIEHAISENPDNHRTYLRAAIAYKDMGVFEKAMYYVDQSIDTYNEYWYAHYVKAEIFEMRFGCREALQEVLLAMELGLEEAEVLQEDFKYEMMVKEKIDFYRTEDCEDQLKRDSELSEEEKNRAKEEKPAQEPEKKRKKR